LLRSFFDIRLEAILKIVATSPPCTTVRCNLAIKNEKGENMTRDEIVDKLTRLLPPGTEIVKDDLLPEVTISELLFLLNTKY